MSAQERRGLFGAGGGPPVPSVIIEDISLPRSSKESPPVRQSRARLRGLFGAGRTEGNAGVIIEDGGIPHRRK